MNRPLKRLALALPVLLVAVSSAGGSDARAQADQQDLYVYTNADLADFEPIPAQDAPMFDLDMDWADLQAFIDGHHGRLQIERRQQIERSLAEVAWNDRRSDYGLALAPRGYWGYGKSRAERIFDTTFTDYANRIVPLHSRTSLIAPVLNNRARSILRTGSGRAMIPVRQSAARGGGRAIKRPSSGGPGRPRR